MDLVAAEAEVDVQAEGCDGFGCSWARSTKRRDAVHAPLGWSTRMRMRLAVVFGVGSACGMR